MMRFNITQKGNFWSGSGRPVRVRARRFKTTILCVFDVAAALGVTVARVRAAAEAESTIQSIHCELVFHLSWATEEELREEFPDAVFVNSSPSSPPRPCTIHYLTSGRYARSEDVDMRTMTATRDFLELTRRQFEAIVHQAPGYRSFLPVAAVGITVHPHNWVPASGVFFAPVHNPEPLWGLRTLRNGHYRAFLRSKPSVYLDFASLREIPESILKSMILVP
jgi:hypothetical protein